MLMAVVALPYSRSIAVITFGVGAASTLVFGVWRHGALWRGGRTPSTTTPVLYLPTVAGNFVTAIVASQLGWPEWGKLFFGAGLLAWLAIESVVLQRMLTAEEMPPALRPTLGIHLAPSAVGLLAYTSVTSGVPSLVASALLGYALLQALLLIRLLPWISQLGFGPGYWAFTFGVTAMTLASERLTDHGATAPISVLSPVLFVIANLLIGGLAVASLIAMARGHFLPPPPPPPSPDRTS
jgi:tellurite resistance protein